MNAPLPFLRAAIFLSALWLALRPCAAVAGGAVDSVVVFNEIMYHPTDVVEAGEFIELHNQMGIKVDLSDWALTGGVNYTFADNTVMAAGGYLVIAKTPSMFPGALGPWTGSLSNTGETIRLRDKNGRLMDELSYGDSGSWPIGADGSGASLTKLNEDNSSPEAGHWAASSQIGGTPGVTNFPTPPNPVTSKVISLASTWKYNNAGTDLGTAWRAGAYDDTVAGWQSSQGGYDFGNPTIYDDYVTPPVAVGYAEIKTVTIAAKSSEAITSGLGRAAVNCINGNGLTNGQHGTVATNNMWLSTGTVLSPNDPLPAQISFDLGSVQNLTSIHVWNYNEFGTSNLTNRGSKTVEILVASSVGGAYTSVGTYTFAQASGLTTYAGEEISFVRSGVRQIQFNITANWGNTNSYAGLSEVKFYNDQPPVADPPPVHREKMTVGLPNTGINTDGSVVISGQRDPHYINTATNLGPYVEIGHPAWLAADNVSQWVGPTANGQDNTPAIAYTYRLNADLSVWKIATATVNLYVSVDNTFDRMRVNGTVITPGATAFDRFYGPYSVASSLLLAGANVLEFDWTNSGSSDNPAGFRTKWDATAVPIIARTALASNPVTTYFRQKFTWNGNPLASYNLSLEHLVDDGAVFYLNGQEILRQNLPAGALTASTLASSAVLYPRFSGGIVVPATAFQVGVNTLAVELHQAAASDIDALFAASLTLTETPPPPSSSIPLVFNEVSSATLTAGGFFVEISNRGSSAQALGGYRILSSTGASYTFPVSNLAGNATLALTDTQLGFLPAAGDKLFFLAPGSATLVDALAVDITPQARTSTGLWQRPNASTPGSGNTFTIPTSVVINEIMFHHQPSYLPTGSTADSEQWVEIYNRSASPVVLTGWALHGGADYTFPNTTIPVGGYLVVAAHKLTLAAKYPAITIVGDWSGSLSHSGDTVRLEDANGNTVSTVSYAAGGRWDERAAGGGSSLELRNPDMDATAAESWAGSDETAKSTWQTYTYSGLGALPAGSNDPTQYNEFIMGMLSGGECLVDDVSVIDQSASNVQLIQDGGFVAGNASKWRLLGNHGSQGRSLVVTDAGNPVLKITATGPTEHMHNHCETTLKNGAAFVTLDSTHTYTISFRAKWLSGVPRLQTRLYFNRLARQHLLPIPMNNGTPGVANTKFIATAPPTLSGLTQTPVLPAAGLPVLIRVTPSTAVPVASVTLKWQKDTVGTWTDVAMTLNSAGQYEGNLPGQTAGSLVQFYLVATASNGQTAAFPAGGTNSRAMVRWADGTVPPGPGYGLRILMPTADADFMHNITNVMSNDALPCTVIYRESEIFYDASVRLKSSERGRYGDPRLGFAINFDPTHKFRGVHEGVNLDRSAYGPGTTGSGFGQVDIINQIFAQRAGGIPGMYNDMVYAITPRAAHIGSAQLTMAEYNDVYLDSQWSNGAGSPTFKFDLVYYPTSTVGGVPEGLKQANPDDVRGVNIGQLTGASKEDYRWYYLLGNAHRNDDYSRILNFNNAFGQLAAGNASLIDGAIDVDQWLRSSAAMALVNSNDSYSTGGLPHNLKLYVRPTDGRVLYLPWDDDFFKQATNFAVEGNADLQRIIAISPANRRLFYGHLHDLMNTSYNVAYLTDWVNHLKTYNTAGGNWQEILDYVAARVSFVQADCASKYPAVTYAISTNGGNDFSAATSPVPLAGSGWINIREIRLSPTSEALPVTWTGASTWQTQVPMNAGVNHYTLYAYDYQGTLVGTDTINITNTGTAVAASASNLVISEMNYAPAVATAAQITAGFTDADDFEFLELRNISPTPVDLSQCQFDTGITYTFANGIIVPPGGAVVVPRRTAAFNLRYPGVATLAEYYVAGSNVLRNGGESLGLIDALGVDIKRFTYNNKAPWPTTAAGAGSTLVLVAPRANPDHNDPLSWRASFASLGNPGSSDAATPPANPLADDNQNGSANLVDFATANTPLISGSGTTYSYTRNLAAEIVGVWETSPNLGMWSPVTGAISTRSALSVTTEQITTEIPASVDPRWFLRLRFILP